MYARGSSLLPLLFAQTAPTLLSRKNIITHYSLRKQYLTKQGIFNLQVFTALILQKLIYNFETGFT